MFEEIALSHIEKRGEVADVISFALNKKWGLGLPRLYPVQKFMLKIMHGMKLDRTYESERDAIKIWDSHQKKKVLHYLSEWDYLQFLKEDGRISPTYQEGESRTYTIMACGRRASKSLMSSIVCSYNVYRLLRVYNPQEYYGLTPDSKITFTCVATKEKQAKELFDAVKGQMLRMMSKYDPKMLGSVAATGMTIYTRHDMENVKTPIPLIEIAASPCSGRSLRGPSNIVVVLDEFAHFMMSGSNISDEEVWKAVTPSTSNFGVDGRVLAISSPLSKTGKFWDKFAEGMDPDPEKSGQTLSFQAPTWEVNENVSPEYLHGEYLSDPDAFDNEYGAKWSGHSANYIRDPDIYYSCVTGREVLKGTRGKTYYLGIDVGLVNDSTGLCISHPEKDKVIIDTLVELKAGEGRYEGQQRLELGQVADEIDALHARFAITKAWYDQWQGFGLEEFLRAKGLNNQFEMKLFSPQEHSDMYQTFRRLLREGKIVMFPHDKFAHQLLLLIQETVSGHKLKVDHASGEHNDLVDCVVRSVFLSYMEIMRKNAPVTVSTNKVGDVYYSGIERRRGQEIEAFKANMAQRKRTGGTKRHRALERAQRLRRGGR